MRNTMPASTPSDVALPSPPPLPSRDEWSHVHIERLEVERAVPPSTLAKVRVCIDIGRLLPVDIDAELELEGGPDPSVPDVVRERLWSAHAYQNGRFDFEAHVQDVAITAARCLKVRIRPAAVVSGPPAAAAAVPTLALEVATERGV